jgi:DNA modification methylase
MARDRRGKGSPTGGRFAGGGGRPGSPRRADENEGGPRKGQKPKYGRQPWGEPGAAPKDAPGIKNPYVRFRPLKKPPMVKATTTLWDYPSQHYGLMDSKTAEQGSQKYRGATPSWVIWQVLEHWTKPDAVVVDPFCGSGTTLDVCRDLGRQGRGFDIAPPRKDVERADARKLPLQDRSVDLVFFDPPYADNLTYSDDPQCIGKLHAEDGSWGQAMAQVIKEARRVLRPDGVLAMFVCDVFHSRGGKRSFHPLGLQLATLAEDAKLEMIDHIAVVRHGKTLSSGPGKLQAEREGFMLRGFSHLVVFQRPR